MAERGIDISGARPKHLSVFAGQRFDYVISLCDRVREVCPEFPGQPAAVPLEHRRPGRRCDSYPAFERWPPSSTRVSGSCSRCSARHPASVPGPPVTSGDPGEGGPAPAPGPGLRTVLREWGRIGCIGFGGPPTHIKLLRELCVERRKWLDAQEFEDAIAACNLLPGPASTQLAIFCAWRVRGRLGALAGGLAFIVPGLIVILALSALFLAGSPPLWVHGAGAGAGAAVAAVAVQAGSSLLGASWHARRQADGALGGVPAAGAAAAATIGPWLVLVLLGCGVIELVAAGARGAAARGGGAAGQDGEPGDGRRRDGAGARCRARLRRPVLLAGGAVGGGVLLSVAWVAFKVGALSYGGGFVIIPLMQADAVNRYHWMTAASSSTRLRSARSRPGPVVQTVAVVGYAAAGLAGGLLAAAVAFAPSFAFVLLGASHFGRSAHQRQRAGVPRRRRARGDRRDPRLGHPLARALGQPWQFAVLAGAAVLLLGLRRGVVLTLLAAAATGLLVALAGGPLPH